jgi:hypothetical protein
MKHTSHEHLSRFETFLFAYAYFDKICVSRDYASNEVIRQLDPEGLVFKADMDIEELESQSISIDAALLHKNEKHLQKKSADWLVQHIDLDITDQQIKEFIAPIKSNCFYMYMLARFKTLQVLSLKNQAICIEPMSLSSILTPHILEVPGLHAFICEMIGRDGLDQREHLGYYIFDDLSLQHELKIKLPCVMQLYSEIRASTSGVEAAKNVEAAKKLRSRCAIWRESMRKFLEDLFSLEFKASHREGMDEWPKSIDLAFPI